MTLAASSQRSQIIRSKFRSVLQLRIHRRNQDPTSDLDPWISAPGLALAPALPSAPAPFLFGPGVLLPDPERCPWQHPQQESPKVSPHWRAPKPQATLTYHQYRPPEQGYRARGEPRGPPPWGGTSSRQPSPRLELQTLKLEELTVKANPAPPRPPLPHSGDAVVTAPAPVPTQPLAPVLTPSSAPAPADLTLEEELQEAIRRAQLLPSRGINDILEDQVDPDDLLPPIPLDFPSSFDVLSPSPDSEGLSVFSSSLQSLVNSPSSSPGAPTEALDWLEALSGGPPLGSGPPGPSIFSVDLSEFGGAQLWDLLEDPW
ncbi:MEF2-activating motif and SAP domain-containing transcriptional regulator isoform X8 [Heterocephalus glaber]|uniref:MEF2-activating motif and SAP domain-containing transcriptional regulator isoform X8 n=1 Tax=Heterocephalus glaber TaxID=10181 RepID=A0AAX6RZA3_HETGA|nr:MEF2-activating motif and SAP domain-containing transcriptional regulator isoform X8 [Heterocephalus glaber]